MPSIKAIKLYFRSSETVLGYRHYGLHSHVIAIVLLRLLSLCSSIVVMQALLKNLDYFQHEPAPVPGIVGMMSTTAGLSIIWFIIHGFIWREESKQGRKLKSAVAVDYVFLVAFVVCVGLFFGRYHSCKIGPTNNTSDTKGDENVANSTGSRLRRSSQNDGNKLEELARPERCGGTMEAWMGTVILSLCYFFTCPLLLHIYTRFRKSAPAQELEKGLNEHQQEKRGRRRRSISSVRTPQQAHFRQAGRTPPPHKDFDAEFDDE